MAEDKKEPSSPVSKQSGEYSLDDSRVINDNKKDGKMSNKSPQKQPQAKPSGKSVTCNVFMLDGESVEFSLDKNDVGRALFDKVCQRLDLIERDYFGFTYTDDRGPSHLKYWLNLDKKISKQKKRGAWVFEFALKFYPPDPTHLRESLTRWLVVLQIRRDLLSGRIPCTFTTYALLGSYNVQADIGEYDPNDHGHSYEYIRDMVFAPNQTQELLEKIAELHKQHKGQTPDEAEKCFLDNAKKLAMYGVDLHKAKDADNNAVMIGVCASGLLVFRDKLRINRFVWPKILKLSYKRNHFYIKIRPGELERHETTMMFKLDNHRLAKRLWKTCVEHHAFFRLREAEKPANNVAFPRFGSKFRYSGRTLYQTRQTAALLDRPPPFFERQLPGRNSMQDAGNRSRSMDELGRGRNRGDPYDDSMYDPNRSATYDPNRSHDENDRRDFKGPNDATLERGRGGDGRNAGDEDTLQRRPYDTDTADRRGRMPSQGDATLEREGRQGEGYNDSMGVAPAPVETDKERRKREKEEDKQRKKEAEEKKKKEEEERKKNKGKRPGEDRTDRMGAEDATLQGRKPGSGTAGLDDGDLEKYDGDKDKDGLGKDGEGGIGKDGKGGKRGRGGKGSKSGDGGSSSEDEDGKPKWGKDGRGGVGADDRIDALGGKDGKGPLGGLPYGVGLGVGKGDMTGVVGDEGEVDNKQRFMPIPKPARGTKASIKGFSDNLMGFDPAATSTIARGKQPPPVPPKKHSLDDSFNYKTEKDGVEETRVVQKVTVSGDEEDDFDFDAALADAIRSVTEFNPDMSVERIECVQQIEDVKDGK